MTIANALTFFRIFISPIFLLVYIAHDYFDISAEALPYVLFFLLGMSELSDALDGYLARKYNQVSDLGKIFDPMADSIYRLSVFLTFTQDPVRIPMLVVFVFLYRDIVISTLRTICAMKGFTLAARPSGKLKAVIQALAAFIIIALMIPHSLGWITSQELTYWSTIAASIAALYSFASGVEYIYANREYVSRVLTVAK